MKIIMSQLHQDAQSKTSTKTISGNTNNLKEILNHPHLTNPIWPTIFSWLTNLSPEPNQQWVTHPTHPQVRAQVTTIATKQIIILKYTTYTMIFTYALRVTKPSPYIGWEISVKTNCTIRRQTIFSASHPPSTTPIQTPMKPNHILVIPPGEAHLPAQPNRNKSVTKIIAKIPSTVIDTKYDTLL